MVSSRHERFLEAFRRPSRSHGVKVSSFWVGDMLANLCGSNVSAESLIPYLWEAAQMQTVALDLLPRRM